MDDEVAIKAYFMLCYSASLKLCLLVTIKGGKIPFPPLDYFPAKLLQLMAQPGGKFIALAGDQPLIV